MYSLNLMNNLIISQIVIILLFLKNYKYLPILINKDNKDIYSGGYLFAFSLVGYLIFSSSNFLTNSNLIIFPLIAFIIGALDDKININPFVRIFLFCLLVIILINSDSKYELNFINFDNNIYKIENPFSIFFTCLCFLLLINAMNFADGIDGLAGSIFIFFYLYIAIKTNLHLELILIIVVCLLTFLFLNFKKKCYLGDGGVYLLSFLLAQLIIVSFKLDYKNFLAEEIFLLLCVPGYDLLRLFFSRLYKKTNPFKGDQNHLHHLLIKKFSLTNSLLIYMMSIVTPLFFYNFLNIDSIVCLILSVLIYLTLFSYVKN